MFAPVSATIGRAPPESGALSRIDVWIFDLDNTLYPASCNLFPLIERRMAQFIVEWLGVAPAAALQLRHRLFRDHGTTMRGLMVEFGVDPTFFLDFVHAIDLSVLAPAPMLEAALARLPGRKMIFTNGSVRHAEAVMARLGVAHHFSAIHDIAASVYVPKPDPRGYVELVRRHGLDPKRCCMIEDMARNLVPAASLGMTTVWVRTDLPWGQPGAGDAAIIHHITPDLPAWLAAVPSTGGAKPETA